LLALTARYRELRPIAIVANKTKVLSYLKITAALEVGRLNVLPIRHGERETDQSDDGTDEPLGLPQCQTEDHAHRQRR
jgi:hypothetical protein